LTKQGHIIVGTAGHIDHGKTSLVKVLTGVDTDRLKEEKERGITIELGFAPLNLPSGIRVGLVDVPGHERFVKNMVAGATGIDLVLLVIAADEGVMPQTREHLDICQLLGTRGGVVVLTKTDMVDDDWLELVTEDVKEYMSGTFLEDAPVVPFSSVDGSGKGDLLRILDEMAAKVPSRSASGIFRLPVDRVFSMKGFGTVVTGTLISGGVRTGDEVVFYPGQMKAKLRGVQVHGGSVKESFAGIRTALNLQGVEKDQINRGDTASHAGTLAPTFLLDARIQLLSSAPRALKNRARVRLNLFTSEVMARVILLDSEILEPGQQAFVQLRMDAAAVAQPGDRFVLRSYSPITTIGGGVVLDPVPVKHRRMRQPVLDHLSRLDTEDLAARMEALLADAGDHGIRIVDISPRAGIQVKETLDLIKSLESEKKAVLIGSGEAAMSYSSESYEGLKGKLVNTLNTFHKANPVKPGMGREELRMKFARNLPDKPYRNLLSALQEKGEIHIDGDIVRVQSHQATLTPEQEALGKKVSRLLETEGLSAPFLPDMAETLSADAVKLKPVLNLMAQNGKAIRIKDDYFIHPDANRDLLERVERYFNTNKEMHLKDFREIAETTRKWMIPLLEYLDRTQVTMRRGDVRIRRGTASGGNNQ
jgi:selenocysteine-specific elongation factor